MGGAMSASRIATLLRLGLFDSNSVAWLAELDADEADEVFAIRVGTLVWAD